MYYAVIVQLIRVRSATEKSDIYAFGIVMYEVLTRKTPYFGLKISKRELLQVRDDDDDVSY